MRALAIVAVLAALVGLLIALVTYYAVCQSEADGSTTCPDGAASFAVDAQRILGYVGLLPVGIFAVCAFTDRRRAAFVWLGIAVIAWIAWGVLNDAAVHGWDGDLKFANWSTLVFGLVVVTIGLIAFVLAGHARQREPSSPAPPAWYPDPDDPEHAYRYWNGRSWTVHRAPRRVA